MGNYWEEQRVRDAIETLAQSHDLGIVARNIDEETLAQAKAALEAAEIRLGSFAEC